MSETTTKAPRPPRKRKTAAAAEGGADQSNQAKPAPEATAGRRAPAPLDRYRSAGTAADHAATRCPGELTPAAPGVAHCGACVKHWTTGDAST